jgi:hypothetical protein
MTISPALFTAVILVALFLVMAAPFVLLYLLLRDWRTKRLW